MWIIELFRTATFRLGLWFALAVTASTGVVFLFIYWQVATFDIKRVEVRLVDEVAKAMSDPEDQLKRELELRFTDDLRRADYAALFDKMGQKLYGNVAALPDGLAIDGQPHTLDVTRIGRRGFVTEPAVLVAGRRPDGSIIVLGRSLYEVYELRQLVLKALLFGIAPAILLALVVGTIFSLRGTRRLRAIHQTIERIMAGDLHQRLPAHGKRDDIDQIASAVNRMLDEIVRLLRQIKSVGDNIAHDLRTPLAITRAKLERGLVGRSDQDLRSGVNAALATLDHALTTVTALLRISEIELGRQRNSFTQVDLTEVCMQAFELYEPLAEAKSITFAIDSPAPLPFVGDFDLLIEAVANLIDNAIKFTPKGGRVEVTAKSIDGGFAIRVSDTGPGVAAAEKNDIFKRFYRSEKCRHIPGVGLGLSMAASIINLHGLEIRVLDNPSGAIFEITPRDDLSR